MSDVRRANFHAERLTRTFVCLFFDVEHSKTMLWPALAVPIRYETGGQIMAMNEMWRTASQGSQHDDGNDVNVCLQISERELGGSRAWRRHPGRPRKLINAVQVSLRTRHETRQQLIKERPTDAKTCSLQWTREGQRLAQIHDTYKTSSTRSLSLQRPLMLKFGDVDIRPALFELDSSFFAAEWRRG